MVGKNLCSWVGGNGWEEVSDGTPHGRGTGRRPLPNRPASASILISCRVVLQLAGGKGGEGRGSRL